MRKLCSKRKIQIHLPRFIISTWSGSTGRQPAPAARLESWDHKYRDNGRTNTSSQARRILPRKLDLRLRLEPLILKPNPCGNSKNVLILTPPAEPNLQTSHQNCLAIVEANTQARDCQDPATVDNLCYNLNSASLHLVGMRPHVGGHNSWCDSGGCCWRGDNSSALALDSQHQHRPATSLIIISLQTPTTHQSAGRCNHNTRLRVTSSICTL